ncbi:MAG: TonB-dependent receptor, partial [Gammaproteobacteria bacterium]|nr:TonB-dependent receptor [Gammaproteobacteria bacterium]
MSTVHVPNRSTTVRRIVASILLTPSVAAFAQAQAPQSSTAQIEEIVVTAQKRASNLQDTPIALSAVTGDSLEKLNIDDIGAIAAANPSLVYSEAGGEAQLYIRGIGSNIFSIGVDQSVATHIDGVYTGRANMGLTQFLDIDRVEILRGPQGTLYGRNATGGAINIISRAPTDEFEGYVSGVFGSFDRVDVRGALSGPLSETVSARVAVRRLKDDGYTEDLDPRGSNRIDDNDLTAVRGSLRLKTDALTATLIAEHSKFDNGNTSIFPIDNTGLAESFGAKPNGDIHKTYNNTPSFHKWTTGGATGNLDWTLTDSTNLNLTVGYRDWDSDFLFNTDGTDIEITRSSFIYTSKQLSAELRLSGEAGWGRWLVGGYWFDEDKYGALGLVRSGFTPPAVLPPRSFIFRADGTGEATALFGQLDFKLAERWTLSAGLRYSDEKKGDLLRQSTLLPDNELLGLFTPNVIPDATAATTRNVSRRWDAWTPRVGLEFRPMADRLFYLTYSEGFKSGGFNDLSVVNPPFNPEFIDSIEIGAKTEWLGGRLRANASAFHYDYTDLQVSVFASVGNITTTFTTNAAEATVRGVELDLVAKPTAALDISASLAFLDATYDRFVTPYGSCTAANVSLDTRCANRVGLPRLIDAAGNKLNNAPEFKGSLSATYGIDLAGGGRVSLQGAAHHQGRVYFLPANTSVMSQAAYTLLDLRIGYESAARNLSLGAFVKNLTDEDYFHNIVQFTSTSDARKDIFAIGNALGYPAAGRQWG